MSPAIPAQERGPQRARRWLNLVADLAAALRGEDSFTFLLGAGASLTSGAPSTRRLERSWLDAYPTRLRCREELRENLGELTEQEKQSAIEGLFENIQPHIGYHCLAALGRDRPILVVNLNWDDALERACEQLGVPCESIELGEGAEAITERLDAFSEGVFNLHLHNRLACAGGKHPIGFATYETLRFDERRLIADRFFSRQTVVVGASLTGEHDVSDLLLTVVSESDKKSRETSRPFWIFSRQAEESTEPVDRLTRRVLSRKASDLNFVGGPAVDFDRLLLELSSQLSQVAFSTLQGHSSQADLDRTALPSPKVLAGHLGAPPRGALVIRGDALIGKSLAAALLHFIAKLTEAPEPVVELASGPTDCEMALDRFIATSPSVAYSNRLLILEDPFGSTDSYDSNKKLVTALRKFLKQAAATAAAHPRARLIVTTRASCWQRALAEHGKILGQLLSCSANAADWYTVDELGAFLETLVGGTNAQARREIATGEVLTPIEIGDAVSKRTHSTHREAVIAEKLAFLEVLPEREGFLAVLARLQELSPNDWSHPPLHESELEREEALSAMGHMLRVTDIDERSYLTPAHYSDRDAIDAFFSRHRGEIQPQLDELHDRRGPISAPCGVWHASQAVRRGDIAAIGQLEPELRADWNAALLSETARTAGACAAGELLAQMRWEELDFFCRREIVFEMVRLWPALSDQPAVRQTLEQALADRDGYGCYLVLEAMLYLQAATYPDAWELSGHTEVWDKLASARWPLLREPARYESELALIIDGLLWCPPRVADDEMARWLRPLAQAARDYEPLLCAFLFASVYHPHGSRMFAELDIDDPAKSFGEHALTVEQAGIAAALIEWHLLHQSRARALRYRRDLEPGHAYLLHRGTPPAGQTLPPDQVRRCKHLIEALGAHPEYAGWAIHLGMNINATLGSFDEPFMADIAEVLRDCDSGVVTASITYPVPSQLRESMLRYFKNDANHAALLDAMRDGPDVWGMRMVPGRFNALRPPEAIYDDAGIRWKQLTADRLLFDGDSAFLSGIRSCALELIAEASESERQEVSRSVWSVVTAAGRGDRRPLEELKLRSAGQWGKLSAHEKLRERLRSAAFARRGHVG